MCVITDELGGLYRLTHATEQVFFVRGHFKAEPQ